ncbi:unnamed protein product, partial [Ectocarpus sp. 13 AM-2016]
LLELWPRGRWDRGPRLRRTRSRTRWRTFRKPGRPASTPSYISCPRRGIA